MQKLKTQNTTTLYGGSHFLCIHKTAQTPETPLLQTLPQASQGPRTVRLQPRPGRTVEASPSPGACACPLREEREAKGASHGARDEPFCS